MENGKMKLTTEGEILVEVKKKKKVKRRLPERFALLTGIRYSNDDT